MPPRRRSSLQPAGDLSGADTHDSEAEVKLRRTSMGADIDVAEQRRRAKEWRNGLSKTPSKGTQDEDSGAEEGDDKVEEIKAPPTASKRTRRAAREDSETEESVTSRTRGRKVQKVGVDSQAESLAAVSSTPVKASAAEEQAPVPRSTRKKLTTELADTIELMKSAPRRSRSSVSSSTEEVTVTVASSPEKAAVTPLTAASPVAARIASPVAAAPAPSRQSAVSPKKEASPVKVVSAPAPSSAPVPAPAVPVPLPEIKPAAEVVTEISQPYRSHLHTDDENVDTSVVVGRVIVFSALAFTFTCYDATVGVRAVVFVLLVALLRRLHRAMYD